MGSYCISSWSLLILLLRLYRFLIIAFSSTLFRLALWPSAGKELSHWLSTRIVFILCRLSCMCSFPVWCLGLDVDSIVSVPDHCLFFYIIHSLITFWQDFKRFKALYVSKNSHWNLWNWMKNLMQKCILVIDNTSICRWEWEISHKFWLNEITFSHE